MRGAPPPPGERGGAGKAGGDDARGDNALGAGGGWSPGDSAPRSDVLLQCRCLRCPSSSMELENIVANTVLLKAREGERAAGGERGLEHPCRSRPSAERCPRDAGGRRWGCAPVPPAAAVGVPCGCAGVGNGLFETEPR